MRNVLIVDDEPEIRHSLKGVLEDEGYKVFLAASGEDCLEALKKRSFDVVLLDIWLPAMDGLETLQINRQMRDEHGFAAGFQIDDFTRQCLLEGLDDIGLTLQHASEISKYEATHSIPAAWQGLQR